MKEEGNTAFKSSQWSKAHDLYTQALQIDPCNKATNAKLYFNRATVAAKLKKYQDSVGKRLILIEKCEFGHLFCFLCVKLLIVKEL